MAITPYKGRWTNRRYRTKSSTAYLVNAVVYSDGTDVIPGVATTEDILGITREAKASASNNNPITVAVPSGESASALADVGTGTATSAYEGRLCDLDDTSPSVSLDITTTTESCVRILKALSSTKVEIAFMAQKR